MNSDEEAIHIILKKKYGNHIWNRIPSMKFNSILRYRNKDNVKSYHYDYIYNQQFLC